jgi:hypothetical protein
MISLEDVKNRFVDEINQRAFADKYVDCNMEQETLQVAMQQGISKDSARAALAQVCDLHGFILESALIQEIKTQVEAAFGIAGWIDEKAFNRIMQNMKKKVATKRNDIQIKRMIVEAMEQLGKSKVKTGWFSNWYAAIKKEIGM